MVYRTNVQGFQEDRGERKNEEWKETIVLDGGMEGAIGPHIYDTGEVEKRKPVIIWKVGRRK